MKSEFKDWNEFIKEAQDVKESDIRQSLKEDDKIVALEQQLSEQLQHRFNAPAPARPPATPTSPTAPLRTMMNNFAISCSSAATPPSNPTPQSNNPFLQGGTMSSTNLFAGYSARHKPSAERMTDLTTNTRGKVHHANTAQGWVGYEADKAEWIRLHSSKWGPDETCPYPLTPGTEPVGHGECYKCGHHHTLTHCLMAHLAYIPLSTTLKASTGESLGKLSKKVTTQSIPPHAPRLPPP